jgi:hypothetical protein
MESIQDNDIRMMVEIYMFTYPRKVREVVVDLTRKHCYGCRINHPSQRNHSCLMMSDLEHLNMYFDDAMEEIDCHEVLNL